MGGGAAHARRGGHRRRRRREQSGPRGATTGHRGDGRRVQEGVAFPLHFYLTVSPSFSSFLV